MRYSTRFRIFDVLAVLAVCAVVIWNLTEKSSAQRDRKGPLTKSVAPQPTTEGSEDRNLIRLNTGPINIKAPDVQAERQAVKAFGGRRLHLVRFSGPIQDKWVTMLTNSGVEIINYIPDYTYLVYGDLASVERIQTESKNALSPIQWDGEYKDSYKTMPSVYFSPKRDNGQTGLRSKEFQVQLVKDDVANSETFSLIKEYRTGPIKGRQEILKFVNFTVGLTEEGLTQLAQRPDVVSIYPGITPRKLDERQDMILRGNLTGDLPTAGDYLDYLASVGLTQAQFDATGFVVDLTDSGVDTGVPASPNQFLLRRLGDPAGASRFAYARLDGTPNPGSTLAGCDGHGNLNATIIGGYVPTGGIFATAPHADASGFRYGLGVAPFVKVGSTVIFDPNDFTFPTYSSIQSFAYQNGARISSNSWGAPVAGAYTSDSQAYDALVRDAAPTGSAAPVAGNQEMVIIFSAGNNGNEGSSTLGAPGTGKNIITVGASENVQAFGGPDGCGFTDTDANSAMDMATYSSRGPNLDGRFGPTIVLPGTHITGGAAQNALANPVSGNGAKLACFTAGGVCGGPAPNFDFFPLGGQQWYTASTGTSHSTPAVAGLAALLRQGFLSFEGVAISPALTKALITNSAEYMTGAGAGDTLPSNGQGMGLADLGRLIDMLNAEQIIQDQRPEDVIGNSGETRAVTGTIFDSTKPFRVSLAWTDAPGSTIGNAWVNDLDLEVEIGGNTYKGNVFSGGNSVAGGSADFRNNLESVFLPAGVTGNFVVRVRGTNIAGDGLPGNADSTDQDYALVISNSTNVPLAAVDYTAVSITAESATPANNTPDPGEALTVDLGLHNIGTAETGTVTVNLLQSGGIANPGPSQNYGVLTAGGGSVTRSFTFAIPVSTVCGSSITLTFEVHDGANVSHIQKTFRIGTLGLTLSENFDAVAAPALPAGWTSSPIASAGITWVSETGNSSSAPNSGYANDAATTSGAALTSPSIAINAPDARLEFRNSYNSEAEDEDPSLGYDGAVLEISIDGGPFTDILDAGGSFNNFGYDRTISTDFGSPIAGRRAWSGNSGGYVDTSINLPASAIGHTVQFRWIMAADSSIGIDGGGIRIDDIRVLGSNVCSAVAQKTVRADFDGDGKTDLSFFRSSTRTWWTFGSQTGTRAIAWGLTTDRPLGGDLDGDHKADLINRRDTNDNSKPDIFSYLPQTATYSFISWGIPSDVVTVGNYDSDQEDEFAAYRLGPGFVWIRDGVGSYRFFHFGQTGDLPLAGDFDGDGKSDLVVYRPSEGKWYITSLNGSSIASQTVIKFGLASDKPVPADYDGDGKDDIAIFRPSTSQWWIRNSLNGQINVITFGTATDIPVPGDYDGDFKYDLAFYRNGQWWIRGTTSGIRVRNFGGAGDIPIPSLYISPIPQQP